MMAQHHLFATHPVGKPILRGGSTGPEGSIFIVAIVALIALIIIVTLPRAPGAAPAYPTPRRRTRTRRRRRLQGLLSLPVQTEPRQSRGPRTGIPGRVSRRRIAVTVRLALQKTAFDGKCPSCLLLVDPAPSQP
jgi:hypothetical protein